jgi:hypothetical protein
MKWTDSATNTRDGYHQKDRNRMGSEDLVERWIGLVQKDTETLTVGQVVAWRDERQRIKTQRQVKVDVSKIPQGTTAGA